MIIDEYSFQIWIGLWIIIALIIIPVVLFVKAPYGRHIRQSWGIVIDNKSGWFFMELPTLIICPFIYFLGHGDKTIVTHCFVFLFLVHYINRVFIFPFRIRTKGKKIPLFIIISAFTFNLINGFNIGYEFGFMTSHSLDWFLSWPFILGLVLFCTGMIINWKSDNILIHLRQPGETDYSVPNGFLFQYISCPNHFGEIIEWIGFAILTWSISALAFCIWTISNLIPRSLNHHLWYQESFPDYPKERKAIIPKFL